jgi:hypothetical protein
MIRIVLLLGLVGCTMQGGWSGGFHGLSSGGGGGGSHGGGGDGGGGGGGGGESPGSDIANSPATWKRFEVRGVQLGAPRTALEKTGFVCAGKKSRCYKVVDKRCEQGTCLFKEDKLWGEQWFELNGVKTELEFITCAFTDTDSALAYDCTYKFGPRQLLTEDSTLGKALIKKYGAPTDIDQPSNPDDPVGGGRFRWANKDESRAPQMNIDCEESAQGRKDAHCRMFLSCDGILSSERDKQQTINEQRRRDRQPVAAPEL